MRKNLGTIIAIKRYNINFNYVTFTIRYTLFHIVMYALLEKLVVSFECSVDYDL